MLLALLADTFDFRASLELPCFSCHAMIHYCSLLLRHVYADTICLRYFTRYMPLLASCYHATPLLAAAATPLMPLHLRHAAA